jgi:hypothetical protein
MAKTSADMTSHNLKTKATKLETYRSTSLHTGKQAVASFKNLVNEFLDPQCVLSLDEPWFTLRAKTTAIKVLNTPMQFMKFFCMT